ncbi:hypothetical protein PHMEG_00029338 [Phytophthora megakarya]|uniref:Uncharacterized protein n=1 Tax=Phytophthora megakarya TaxID=4795 RepID=A0A225V2X5_9STRA|nr:hypothetical protein PHMEG_00029338 [Phytophthora megakarya]
MAFDQNLTVTACIDGCTDKFLIGSGIGPRLTLRMVNYVTHTLDKKSIVIPFGTSGYTKGG